MNDLVILAVSAACFGACIAYISLCDRIIGPDPLEVELSVTSSEVTE